MPHPVHLQPFGEIIANRRKLILENPFTVGRAALFVLFVSVVFSVMDTIDSLRWISDREALNSLLLWSLVHHVIIVGVLFAFCFLVYGRCLRHVPCTQPITRYILTASLGSLGLAIASSVLYRWFCNAFLSDFGSQAVIDITTINEGLLAVIVLLVSTFYCTGSRRHQMLVENERLRSEQLLIRCEAMEQQLNPHFLFNSLNTLGGLIGMDDDRARTYLQQLASAYRYVTQQKAQHLTPLSDEMQFVDTYLDMMQTRYGDNLIVRQEVDPAFLGCQVPPISIQLLVENAIKHNVVSSRHPLTITICTTPRRTLCVSNPIQAKQDHYDEHGRDNNTHIGLENLSQRYQMLCHKDISVEYDDKTFSVEIPLI